MNWPVYQIRFFRDGNRMLIQIRNIETGDVLAWGDVPASYFKDRMIETLVNLESEPEFVSPWVPWHEYGEVIDRKAREMVNSLSSRTPAYSELQRTEDKINALAYLLGYQWRTEQQRFVQLPKDSNGAFIGGDY